MTILRNIIDDNKFTPEDIPGFEEKLFFEGAKRRVNLERFAVLLFLSTVIATYGLIGDSTATVIGAMIIAPLMTPIIATAAGLVMGDMPRAGRSFVVVLGGVIGTIGTAWFIGAFLNPSLISFTSNSQLSARVSPNLTDLCVALASGVAGAFAMSRDDVADSLPGVAISIALVPPLAVVGLALAELQWWAAWGAMLLFLTNFLSILLTGGGTLALLGLSAASMYELQTSARRKAFTYIAIGALLIAIPLAFSSYTVAAESYLEYQTTELAQQWLHGSNYELTRVKATRDNVNLVITGFGPVPPLSNLGTAIQTTYNPHVTLTLTVVPSEKLFFPEPTTQP